jgi:Uma2 family endonuclease
MATVIDIGDVLQHGAATLRLPRMTPEEFWEFCRRNPELNVERNVEGDLVFYSPTGSGTGRRNSELTRQLGNWAVAHEDFGFAFDLSTLFTLPNGAVRSPDASWVSAGRWNALTPDEQERPAPICPDFVVELMSPSDTLAETQAKMDEYLANSARLGWLINRKNRRLYVYRPGRPVEELTDPATVSGDPELPGFVLHLARIF